MSRHTNPRIYIGPSTSEVIIPIGRAFGVQADVDSVTIEFTRRKVDALVISTWVSYVIQNGSVHFEIPEEFRTDCVTFPKGFYDGVVSFGNCADGDCIVGDIELIKAPGHYLSDADSIESRCEDDNTWVEPDCADDDAPDPCGCICETPVDNCPTCYNETIVVPSCVKEGYMDEDIYE